MKLNSKISIMTTQGKMSSHTHSSEQNCLLEIPCSQGCIYRASRTGTPKTRLCLMWRPEGSLCKCHFHLGSDTQTLGLKALLPPSARCRFCLAALRGMLRFHILPRYRHATPWAQGPAGLTLPEQSWCLETAVFPVLPHPAWLLYQQSALHVTRALEMTDAAVLLFNKGQHLF